MNVLERGGGVGNHYNVYLGSELRIPDLLRAIKIFHEVHVPMQMLHLIFDVVAVLHSLF